MALEPLAFGLQLMRRRARLMTLASELTDDPEWAGAAVRCTLCEAWWSRADLGEASDLDAALAADLRGKIASDARGCGARAPLCARTRQGPASLSPATGTGSAPDWCDRAC